MIFRIYTLSSSRNIEIVRYIGQTITSLNKRLTGHKYKAKVENNHRACWIRKEISEGYEIIINEIDTANSEDWAEKEIHYIKLFKSFGANLVNTSNGGEHNMLNRKHSIETIEKMKISRSKQIRKPHSEETKLKLRLATLKQIKEKGHPKGMLGKKHSKESIDSMLKTKGQQRKPKPKSK